MEELDQVPEGFNYNHGATWQRLEKNLQGKKQGNTRWWLYAAVILILAGGFLTLKLNSNSKGNTNNENKIVKDNLETPIKILPEIPVQEKTETSQNIINLKRKKTIVKNDKHTEQSISMDKVEIPIVATEPNIIVVPALVKDTVNTNVIVKNQKPKFRIAHINEVNRSQVMVIQSEEKSNTIVYKKPILSSMIEEPLNKEDKIITGKKSRSIFSPVSSSQ